jgi:hypothetical protein
MPVTRLAKTATDGKATAAVSHLTIAAREGKTAGEIEQMDPVDRAIPRFSSVCAGQNERDYWQLVEAVNSGWVVTRIGP